MVREAEAVVKEARFVFETTSQLQKEGVLSRIEFEKAQVRRQGAEAAYQAAKNKSCNSVPNSPNAGPNSPWLAKTWPTEGPSPFAGPSPAAKRRRASTFP